MIKIEIGSFRPIALYAIIIFTHYKVCIILILLQLELCQEIYDLLRNHKLPDGRMLCESMIRLPKKRFLSYRVYVYFCVHTEKLLSYGSFV